MSASVFNGLNDQQKKAVEHAFGPSIILAGAGSGKTRVLIQKVKNLIEQHNVSPSSIIMITFTNKAAKEMKERIGNTKRLGYIGTFHSFCARSLRIDGSRLGIDQAFTIYDETDQLDLIKSTLKEKKIEKFSPSFFLHRISAAKNELISSDKYLEFFSDHTSQQIAEVYARYQVGLRKNKALDFDDLLIKTIELFSFHPDILKKYQERYKFLLVDEFQDTNFVQYLLTKLLGQQYKNVTIVGDFSQSIYSWRGADIGNLEKFKKDFPEAQTFHLEKNYRSSQKILDFAYKIISKNKTHPILNLFTENDTGEEIIFFETDTEQEEALFIVQEIERLKNIYPYKSFVVLYRTNVQSRTIEEAFLHYGIPYVLVGGTRFYERKEVKDVLAYLRLIANPDDLIAKERAIKLGKRRWEKFKELYKTVKDSYREFTTEELMEKVFREVNYLEMYNPNDPEDYARLENIKELKSVAISFPELVQFLEQIALVESEYFSKEKKGGIIDGVKLMTLHQAKGLEFDCVFIVGVEEGILPHSRSIDDYFQLEEERRLFYVGITRARKKLYITYARRRFIFGRRGETIKSRFLFESEDTIY